MHRVISFKVTSRGGFLRVAGVGTSAQGYSAITEDLASASGKLFIIRSTQASHWIHDLHFTPAYTL